MKPSANQPRKLDAYAKGYAAGLVAGDPEESNPYRGKHGNWNRAFEDAWRDGWVDGWAARKTYGSLIAGQTS